LTAGAWTTAFGTFAGVNAATAPGFPLPNSLGGVTVAVEGVSAPVYFVNNAQINFLIPARTQPGLRTLRVTTAAGSFDAAIQVIPAGPGLFTKSADTPPKGAVLNQNSSENLETNRAVRGETIQIYGTGPGSFNANVEDGAAAPSSPLTTTVSTPQVYIGGVEATVQFSGLAPGFPGLWQVNAAVPSLPFISGKVPVVVYMNGVDSNEVFIFVQ
jgi:uncharacterized protein (TIGR03437 family)